jgi:hypothetical protein
MKCTRQRLSLTTSCTSHDQVIDPAGAHPLYVCLHDHRVQGDVDPPARLEQRRKERPGPHLRGPDRDVAGSRGDGLVAGAVALRRPGRGALVRRRADARGRLGVHQRLQVVSSSVRISSPPSARCTISASSSRADWSRAIV